MIDRITKLPKWLTIGLVIPLLVLNGWLLILVCEYFESLITIFVAATLLSFVLDYPVQFIEQRNIPRATRYFSSAFNRHFTFGHHWRYCNSNPLRSAKWLVGAFAKLCRIG